MSFDKATQKFVAETYVTVGCLGCPDRQVLTYGNEPDSRPVTTLRAGLVAAAQCALLKAGLPEGHMPPYEVTQRVDTVTIIDEQFLSNGCHGIITGVKATPPECPADCAVRVPEVVASVRGAIEQARQI